MRNRKITPVKRQKSMHTQINCKPKLELNDNCIPNQFHKKSYDSDFKNLNNDGILILPKRKSFQINKRFSLKPINRKKYEYQNKLKNTPEEVKKQIKIWKPGKIIPNNFRNGRKIHSKLNEQNKKNKLILNCEEKEIKSKLLLDKILLEKINLEENGETKNRIINSDYKYKDDKIEIVYNSLNNYICSSVTQKGFCINREKEKANNQDISLIIEDVCGIKNYNIYCIMDGHGSNGHLVSNYIKEKIIQNFCNISFYFNKIITKPNASEYPDNILELIKKNLTKNDFKKIKEFYKSIDEGLSANEIFFDINFSGSTCIILFLIGNYLICSNVGDSRAILIKENNEIIELSKDQKPDNENEKIRIENMGGIVSQCNDLYDDGKEGGPFRIWMKGEDYPGIAMSRSIGDKIAHEIGVIAEPEIFNMLIDDKCECLIIGSDGVWQYIPNEEISDIIKPFLIEKKVENAAKEIVRKSSLIWIQNEMSVDDITVSLIFLKK